MGLLSKFISGAAGGAAHILGNRIENQGKLDMLEELEKRKMALEEARDARANERAIAAGQRLKEAADNRFFVGDKPFKTKAEADQFASTTGNVDKAGNVTGRMGVTDRGSLKQRMTPELMMDAKNAGDYGKYIISAMAEEEKSAQVAAKTDKIYAMANELMRQNKNMGMKQAMAVAKGAVTGDIDPQHMGQEVYSAGQNTTLFSPRGNVFGRGVGDSDGGGGSGGGGSGGGTGAGGTQRGLTKEDLDNAHKGALWFAKEFEGKHGRPMTKKDADGNDLLKHTLEAQAQRAAELLKTQDIQPTPANIFAALSRQEQKNYKPPASAKSTEKPQKQAEPTKKQADSTFKQESEAPENIKVRAKLEAQYGRGRVPLKVMMKHRDAFPVHEILERQSVSGLSRFDLSP